LGKNKKNVDYVNTNDTTAIRNAIEYLKQNGHEKIAFIGEKFTLKTKNMVIAAMNALNIPVRNNYFFISEKRFEDAGYECMEKIYSLKDKPTAIFTGYDNIALGAMNCIKDHGDSVPNDFSIISRNNISFSSHKTVSLTTINSNVIKLCEFAIEHMFKKQDRKHFKIREKILVKPELVIRNSVKDLTKN
jgi:LacI family transcriptional regulator